MLPKRYRFMDVHDEMAEVFNHFLDFPLSSHFSFRGRLVNEDDYDIVPKPHLRERIIKEKEKELATLKDKQKELEEEIKRLSP